MKRVGLYIAVIAAGISLLVSIRALAANNPGPEPAWTTPSATALKRISPLISSQHEAQTYENTDCTLITYRLVSTSEMHTGCFGETSYGLFDSDNAVVIYNGSDEGVPLYNYLDHQVFLPWQKADDLVSLIPATTSGFYIGIYRNLLTSTQNRRTVLGQLTGKELDKAADVPLRDSDGRLLIVNQSSIAFSSNGSWMVAEALNGTLVRINLASLEVLPFAQSLETTGTLSRLQISISNDGHYVAVNNNGNHTFDTYNLQQCTDNRCQTYSYESFISKNIPAFQALRHLRFVNNGLISFEVQAYDVDVSGTYELAPTDSIHYLIDYLGLGDSFSSGEGAFDYRAGTDTATDKCHQSINAYPNLLTRDLFSATGGHSVACSGAVINDVGSTSDSYHGQVAGVGDYTSLQAQQSDFLNTIYTNYLPGYIAQQHFIERYQPRIITVGIGGNDIGFGDILLKCVLPHLSRHLSDQICFNTYEDRLEIMQRVDKTVAHWTTLYKQLAAEDPGVQLYAIGYPSIASDTGNCGLNALLSKNELEFAEELIDYLNGSIAKAATNAGVTYVDISKALVGHRLCEATP